MEKSNWVRAARAALERDPDVNLHHNAIEVTTTDGELRLDGVVDTIVAKRRALHIVRAAAGDLPVVDRLRVRVSRQREGDELLQAVLAALTTEAVFREFTVRAHVENQPPPDDEHWLEVAVDGNRVRLFGQVWSVSHRRMAEVIAWWIPGTADVDNRIHVQPAEIDHDDDITDLIRQVIEKDPSLDAGQIRVDTVNGEVTLRGAVDSDAKRRIACYDCWYVPGVRAVHNTLEVRAGH